MRITIIRSVVVAVVAVAVASAQPMSVRTVSVSLSRPVFSPQQASNWCWAATVSNLFAYYGYPVEQQRVVTQAYGAPVNMTGGDYSNMARLLNRSWSSDSGERFKARLVAALDVPNGISSITNDEIRDALAQNQPLVIGTTSHAMLVVGMTYTDVGGSVGNVLRVKVFDPWPGIGLRDARTEEITPAPRGGTLLFVAYAKVGPVSSDIPTKVGPARSDRPTAEEPNPSPVRMGRSCRTPVLTCGPFYNQPALPVGDSCWCATLYGPAAGKVVRP